MAAKHIAVIPARKGSKSIKDKNLQKIGGKNLIDIVYTKAMKSNIFDKIVISSDYHKSAILLDESVRGNTRTEIIQRPANLCTDSSLMVDVIEHALGNTNDLHVWLWVLQPTSPFAELEDFNNIKKILDNYDENPDKEIKSVISYSPVPVNFHPDRVYTLKDLSGFTEAFRLKHTNFANKQDLKTMHVRSGNFYVVNINEFKKRLTDPKLRKEAFYIKPCFGYEMDDVSGLNIDTALDLHIAKWYVSVGRKKVK